MDGKLICLFCFVVVINYISVGNGKQGQNNLVSSKNEKTRGLKRVIGRHASKKIQADQIVRSIQLGIQNSIKSLASKPKRDLLPSDFETIETTVFPRDGTDHTPRHQYPEFTFKSYAPIVFENMRKLYRLQSNDYMTSFCSSPLNELSNPGASGSKFYITPDDKFIMKTVEQGESRFLQKLLPGYYSNLNKNPSTLLPHIFGFYRYRRNLKNLLTKYAIRKNSKNFALVAMNNLLPSNLNIHEKYDLKGSTHLRKASKKERKKPIPTYKDLDFKKKHPDGIFLKPDKYKKLVDTLQRDCKFLESSEVMDYSILIGVHYVNRAQETKKESTLKALRNFMDFKNYISPKGGIPAVSGKKEDLLLFVGIIDILQKYNFKKKIEHTYKAVIHDRKTVSVQKPKFYASRFLNFMTKSVFKQMSGPLK